MIKIKPRNSTLKINKMTAEMQNVKIKNKTECTGFSEIKTKTGHKTNKNNKR